MPNKSVETEIEVMKTEIKYIKNTQEEHGAILKEINDKIDNGFQKIAENHQIGRAHV